MSARYVTRGQRKETGKRDENEEKGEDKISKKKQPFIQSLFLNQKLPLSCQLKRQNHLC